MIAKMNSGQGFRGLLQYLADPEKMEWSQGRNVFSEDPAAAAGQMQFTAMQSEKVEKPVYHVSISWEAGDNPTREEMLAVAERWLEGMGLQEHQAMLIAHGDTRHPHLHLAINRVHPDSEVAWDRSDDRRRSEEILRGLETEYGWRLVPGKNFGKWDKEFDGRATETWERKQPEKARQAAAGMGIQEDVDGRSVMERAQALKDQLFKADSFAAFDRALSQAGLWLEPKGQGMVITDGTWQVKASEVSRHFSGSRLEEKFGEKLNEFAAAREARIDVEVGLRLVTHWKSELEKQELKRVEQALSKKEGRAAARARKIQELDRQFTEDIKAAMRDINQGFTEAYKDGQKARQAFSRFLKEPPVELGPAGRELATNPGRFGKVRDEAVILGLCEAFREADRIKDRYARFFEGLSGDQRNNLVQRAKQRASALSADLASVRDRIHQQARREMRQTEGGKAVDGGIHTALSVHWALQQLTADPSRRPGEIGRQLAELARGGMDTEASRALSSMGGQAVRYTKAIAGMLANPGAGSANLVKNVIQDSVRASQEISRGRERE